MDRKSADLVNPGAIIEFHGVQHLVSEVRDVPGRGPAFRGAGMSAWISYRVCTLVGSAPAIVTEHFNA